MKFGAVANQSGVEWQEVLDMWKKTDAGDAYDSLWLMDHFVTGFGSAFGSEGPCFEGWTALAALAQATSRVTGGLNFRTGANCMATAAPTRAERT